MRTVQGITPQNDAFTEDENSHCDCHQSSDDLNQSLVAGCRAPSISLLLSVNDLKLNNFQDPLLVTRRQYKTSTYVALTSSFAGTGGIEEAMWSVACAGRSM
jgi:hypothetical protein